MEFKEYLNKKVNLKLRDGSFYSGEIVDVDDSIKPLIWITIIDKFNKKIVFVHSEVIKMEEVKE